MWEKIGLIALGFLGANIINIIEVGILFRILKDIKQMLRQFKQEGKREKWLE